MNRVSRAVLALTAVLALLVSASLLAQAQQAAPAGQTAKPVAKWVTPFRGAADVLFIGPDTKRVKDDVVTTVKVKNTSPGPLVRLKVEEFWYDKAGNLVVGGDDWCRKPLMPGDEWTATITTARDPRMYTNNLKFSHANGTVKPKKVKKFD
jgi:hypothetical protein